MTGTVYDKKCSSANSLALGFFAHKYRNLIDQQFSGVILETMLRFVVVHYVRLLCSRSNHQTSIPIAKKLPSLSMDAWFGKLSLF